MIREDRRGCVLRSANGTHLRRRLGGSMPCTPGRSEMTFGSWGDAFWIATPAHGGQGFRADGSVHCAVTSPNDTYWPLSFCTTSSRRMRCSGSRWLWTASRLRAEDLLARNGSDARCDERDLEGMALTMAAGDAAQAYPRRLRKEPVGWPRSSIMPCRRRNWRWA